MTSISTHVRPSPSLPSPCSLRVHYGTGAVPHAAASLRRGSLRADALPAPRRLHRTLPCPHFAIARVRTHKAPPQPLFIVPLPRSFLYVRAGGAVPAFPDARAPQATARQPRAASGRDTASIAATLPQLVPCHTHDRRTTFAKPGWSAWHAGSLCAPSKQHHVASVIDEGGSNRVRE